MGDRTKIEWTDASWNPATGCTKVSPGCDHCYADTIAHRFAGTKAYPQGFAPTLRPERLNQPLRWTRPRRIFVCSMADLFHDQVPDEYIARVWAVMALAPRHTFQVLTKRHGRLRSLLSNPRFAQLVEQALSDGLETLAVRQPVDAVDAAFAWARSPERATDVLPPLPNVWIGVSAENQQWADLRIPALLATPAAVRWVSAEPLLGGIVLPRFCTCGCGKTFEDARADPMAVDGWPHQILAGVPWTHGIDWLVAGGESGPDARPVHPDWLRSLRDQCDRRGVAFHFKQWGEWAPFEVERPTIRQQDDVVLNAVTGKGTYLSQVNQAGNTQLWRIGKKAAGRTLDGQVHDGEPEVASA